ncbi:MAG: IPT/TIG domain-containing protein [Acidobacteria bacterium]|nr:IPT/TIG domain-containing protein [Acidobacteriota bacterium]
MPSRQSFVGLLLPGMRIFFFSIGVMFLLLGVLPRVSAQAVTITSIKPNQTGLGQSPPKIVIKGTGFVTGTRVLFNNTEVAAIVKPSGRKIVVKQSPQSFFQNSGVIAVKVILPGGQESNTVQLVVGSQNSIVINEPASLAVNTGGTIRIRASVVDLAGNPVPNAQVAFQSETPEVATVDSTGTVTGKVSGAATLLLSSSDTTRRVVVAVSQVINTVPSGIFGDGDIKVNAGTVYASDLRNHLMKSAAIGSPLGNLAGSSGTPGDANGGFAASRFNGPLGIGFGNNVLLLADTANRAVRRLNLNTRQVDTIITLADVRANVSTVADWGPRGVVQTADGSIYITDQLNHVLWRARLSGAQVSINVFAGTIGESGLRDELGQAARFNGPQELEFGSANVLAVSDRLNKVVRLVALPSGLVSTIRSNASRLAAPQRGQFEPQQTNFAFSDPFGVDLDPAGNVYVADGTTVRVVSFQGGSAEVNDLAQPGTFQKAIGVSISNNAVFVLDSGKGQVLQVGIGAPTIQSASPVEVTINQSVEVTLKGTNFLPGTQVQVNGQLVSAIVESASQLRFILPAQTLGGSLGLRVLTRGGSAQTTINVVGPPAAPSNLSARAISGKQVDLSWTDNSTNETGFVIERRDGDVPVFVPIFTTGPDITSFSNTGLKAGTLYGYRVRAVSDFGESPNSNEAIAVPSTPVEITFTPSTTLVVPEGSLTLGINFKISDEEGAEPGTVTLDIPLDPRVFDLNRITIEAGKLIPAESYPADSLFVAPYNDGIRIVLSSSKDPLNAKLNSGLDEFCKLTLPILATAPFGDFPIDASATLPFGTQLNQPLINGGQPVPFVSQATMITVVR